MELNHTILLNVVSKIRIAENVVRGATSNESAVLAESIKRKQIYFCEEDDDQFVASVEINKVNKLNNSIIWVTTKIDGHAMKMELDTGSAVSIIPLQKYKQMFRRRIPLEKTEVTLKTYSGKTMTPEGIIKVSIQYNHQTKVLPLFVVNTAGPALFGRDWLHEFIYLFIYYALPISHKLTVNNNRHR